MKKFAAVLTLMLAAAIAFAVAPPAGAHECTTDPETHQQECHPSPVYPSWRGQYVPLLGMENRDDEQTRREAQRWRDEWGCDTQFCVWLKFAQSVDGSGSPFSVHGGFAGDHSLTEGAHSAEGHGTDEGNHDTHGGAIYFDLCLATDDGTSYEGQAGACKRGPEDTQVGLTVVDHNPCGAPGGGIPLPCTDEYHVVRPLDPAYTQAQMETSQREIDHMAQDPREYLCGYDEDYVEKNPPCDLL